MKNKIFSLTFMIIAANAFATDLDCEENALGKVAKELSLPNCLRREIINSDLCKGCGEDFEKKYSGPAFKINKADQQKKFFRVLFDDYKKNLTTNIIETTKLLTLPGSNHDLIESMQSCKMMDKEKFIQGCASPSAINYLKTSDIFEKLTNETSNEVAKILSLNQSFNTESTLLTRSKKSCFIPEKYILQAATFAVEEMITPDLVEKIQKIDLTKYKNMDQFFEDILEDTQGISEFATSYRSHPYLRVLMENPQSAQRFFQTITPPYNSKNIRAALYNKNSVQKFDELLSKNCKDSFEAFKKTICSKEFEDGNIDLNPEKNYHKLSGEPFIRESSELASTEDLLQKNVNILKYCPYNYDKNVTLIEASEKVMPKSNPRLLLLPLADFNKDKHVVEIGNFNELICKFEGKDCNEESYNCKVINKVREAMGNSGSLDNKLANSSNESIRKLLRSMIGTPTSLTSDAKQILITQGILPKEDGSFIKQPEISERQPEYFQKIAQVQDVGATPVKMAGPAGNTQEAQTYRSPSSEYSTRENSVSLPNSNINPTNPIFSDLSQDNEEIKSIKDEIRRRLMELPPRIASTKEAAKKAVRDSFKATGRSVSPDEEKRFAEEMFRQHKMSDLNETVARASEENNASISDSETQLQKWKKSQNEAALMGMAGAQQVSARDIVTEASASIPKDMTKVALNIPEDQRVTLADIFNVKLSDNDPETQLLKVLLKNNNNFILQVKSMNFKIVFDQNRNFNLLLESGDRKEAERIRPQLEMFLKKLKV